MDTMVNGLVIGTIGITHDMGNDPVHIWVKDVDNSLHDVIITGGIDAPFNQDRAWMQFCKYCNSDTSLFDGDDYTYPSNYANVDTNQIYILMPNGHLILASAIASMGMDTFTDAVINCDFMRVTS